VLYPAKSWPSQEDYDNKYGQLAARFVDNFKKFKPESPQDVIAAGPKVRSTS
jgi:ATP-dependent phosphoenolpyruvate carboxykinase